MAPRGASYLLNHVRLCDSRITTNRYAALRFPTYYPRLISVCTFPTNFLRFVQNCHFCSSLPLIREVPFLPGQTRQKVGITQVCPISGAQKWISTMGDCISRVRKVVHYAHSGDSGQS